MMNTELQLDIFDYREQYARDFALLNYEWLERYFSVEEHDREMLEHPFEHIIEPGGQIFFVKYDEQIVGTAALIVEDENTLELAKMAVKPEMRGMGIGKKLIQYAIKKAKATGKTKLVLESSRKLENAIGLYRNTGFEEVPLTGCSPYARCDIRMSMNL
ncbi:GNAT family N-acetyltransferase [Marinoscillum sp. MHG1-6]|uniref:GNAT family N-acetyltransferase n=1 Tax=Marinoscillum sp. MHG1-6 TaxID=2959627 RepID=UPI00215847BD|nr:GNAT family N-acetyltransferase [Marinoscillum sp. MHG1-6]